MKALSALDDIGKLPDFEISEDFVEQFDNGMLTKKKYGFYTCVYVYVNHVLFICYLFNVFVFNFCSTTTFQSKKDNKINLVLNLGFDFVSRKTWFHILEYGRKHLKTSVSLSLRRLIYGKENTCSEWRNFYIIFYLRYC